MPTHWVLLCSVLLVVLPNDAVASSDQGPSLAGSRINPHEIVQAYLLLRDAGYNEAQSRAMAGDLTAAIVAFKGTQGGLPEAANLIGRMATGRVLRAVDLRRLDRLVPYASREMATGLGVTEAELFAAVATGRVDAIRCINAMMAIMRATHKTSLAPHERTEVFQALAHF